MDAHTHFSALSGLTILGAASLMAIVDTMSGSLLHILAFFLLSLLSKQMPSTPVFPEENGWTVLSHQVGTSSPICQTPEFPSLASCKSRPLLIYGPFWQ